MKKIIIISGKVIVAISLLLVVPRVYTMSKTGTMTVTELLSDEEKEKYGFELISWKFSSPIENTFE